MSGQYISTIIADRWKEAVAEPDVARWLSLSQLAAQAADSIAHHEPESILVASFKGIYEAAYGRALAMMKQEEADENSYSGNRFYRREFPVPVLQFFSFIRNSSRAILFRVLRTVRGVGRFNIL